MWFRDVWAVLNFGYVLCGLCVWIEVVLCGLVIVAFVWFVLNVLVSLGCFRVGLSVVFLVITL